MSFVFTKKDDFISIHPDLYSHLPRIIENRTKEFHGMKNDFAQNNFDAICKFCHKVEGVAVSYGLFQLDEIIRHIHQLARQGEGSEIKKILPVLESYLDHLNSISI